jgi:hypothetical protein
MAATTLRPFPGDVPQLVLVAGSWNSLAIGDLAVACSRLYLERLPATVMATPVTCSL